MKDFIDYNESGTIEKLKHSLRSWKHIGVGKSLLIWFLAISIIPLAIVSLINFLNAYQGLTIVSEKSLNSSSQIRSKYISTFFDDAKDYLNLTSDFFNSNKVIEKIKELQKQENLPLQDLINTNAFNNIFSSYKDEITKHLKEEHFYDYLILDKDGNIVFSINNDNLLGKNLFRDDALLTTRFAKTVKNVIIQKKMIFSDLERFAPSENRISGFLIKPVFGKNDRVVGVDVVEITVKQLNTMIRDVGGYGETGEAYIIGEDLLLRTATRFGDYSEILTKKIVNDKTRAWKDFAEHKNDPAFLNAHEIDKEKVSTYDRDGQGTYVLGIYRYLSELAPYGINWALIEEIEHNEAFANARQLSDYVKVSLVLTFILVFFISILITRWFVNPIKQLSSWSKEVAVGKLDLKKIKAPDNEIGEMRDSFKKLVNTLRGYADVVKLIAKGAAAEKVKEKSQDDVMAKSINQLIESFKSVIEQANKIAEGNYSTVIRPRSSQDSLGKALFIMTETLRKNDKEITEQNWLKYGLADLDKTLKGHTDINQLTQDTISFLCRYLNAQVGLIYLADDQKNLHLKASFAIREKDLENVKLLKPGEGLPGQVLKENKMLTVETVNEDGIFEISSGVKEIKPKQLVIIPFAYKDNVIGVIELGSIEKFTDLHLAFIEQCVQDIALSVVTLQSHLRVKELLERTQLQARELEVQQEELRQANEELQQQTRALRKSEEILQKQKEELKVTNEELEERTRALQKQRDAIEEKNKELEQARIEIEKKAKDLETASRYKSEFLANMSHELRTPLNSIIVLSQLLNDNKKEHLDKKELEFVKTIHSSGIDLLDLINDILDLSKVESGKLELNLEQLYLEDLVNMTKNLFDPVIRKKGLKFITKIDKGLPEYIITDVQRVQQILKNLISNAIKFTAAGSITLHIHKPKEGTEFQNKDLNIDNTIAISVIDTGIGIPKDKQKIIFEAFRQADGTTSRRFGGTGLGLSISRNFAKLLGGEMHLKSEEGKGSTFCLYLPIEAKTSDNNSVLISEKVSKNTKRTKVKEKDDVTKKILDDRDKIEEGDRVILIIEDDIKFATVLMNLAHDHGFKVIIAPTGEIGLFNADYYVPNAIILDMYLPGIDGEKVLEKLKSNSKTRHIPVHFISSSDKNIEVFKMGAVGFLTKPVDKEVLDDLFTKIEKIISKPVKKLLIVEDEKMMRKSIINLMRNENIEITAVEDGNAAYEKLKSEKFDSMILDLGLKDMTGFDLLKRIHDEKIAEKLPIIIYTGKDLSKKETATLEKYSDSIILKGAKSFERLLSETTLFLHQLKSDLPLPKQKMIEKIQGSDNILEGKTILLVDDDMRNVFALTSFLENYKAKVIIARNGKIGVEKLKQHPETDIVLMDIMMPEMDGYEAMRIIRKNKKYKDLPIIALTAKAMKEDREKCIAAGANEYLPKPIDTDKLLSLLRVWLYK
jgi:signal transduction histidine kinase/DNA-binding response OmpR family regulator/HAMP domain-containing protein